MTKVVFSSKIRNLDKVKRIEIGQSAGEYLNPIARK
jgi:hypothetical protein